MAFVARGGLLLFHATLLSLAGWSGLWALQMMVRVQGQPTEDDGNQAHDNKSNDAGRMNRAVVGGIDVHDRREHPEEATRGHGAI